ncbi:hypothetical protein [uncultured Ruminococcus sp.]|uniref:hypothetical protein n=1 Tax=uncultured Ruminococcus sp. TaxID=165186 RepID=UPI0025E023B4|nr:hypothetical protein [uncultured Ruminococcus sp.]
MPICVLCWAIIRFMVVMIAPITYIFSAIFVMTVSVLVSLLFSRRIKRIDMVEVLKGME